MQNRFFAVPVLALSLLIAACGGGGTPHNDTQTSGTIKVTSDDNYEFLVDSEIYAFMQLNPGAKIIPSYKPEPDAFEDFIKDSARVIIVSRELNAAEKRHFDTIKITPEVTTIAYDAVALIVNKDNLDTNLTQAHVEGMLKGKITNWKQVNKKSSLGEIQVVFDNPKSGNARFFQEKFNIQSFSANVQAAKNSRDVIKYVENNKNAIGVIGVNLISDKDDSTSTSFLKNTRVVYMSDALDTSLVHDFFPPLAGHVALREYPFWRKIYMIKREPYLGLGTGFVNFCYYDKGQRIIKLMGLLPANIKAQVVRMK